LQFGLPFLLLLSRDVKENPRRLATVALLVLGMRFLDVFWFEIPEHAASAALAACLVPVFVLLALAVIPFRVKAEDPLPGILRDVGIDQRLNTCSSPGSRSTRP